MKYSSEQGLKLLRQCSGHDDARFKAGQEEAIKILIEGNAPLLVVQRTGWGKSAVYFITTKLLREMGKGLTLLISPLLALMRNQIEAAQRMGLKAATLNSSNREEWSSIEHQILTGELDILVISPERLGNQEFSDKILSTILEQVSLLVIDEAHCISDWGHDFRPHYRLIRQVINTMPKSIKLLATTATANKRVMEDIQSVLGDDLQIMRGPLDRPGLTLQVIFPLSKAERLAWLTMHLGQFTGSGIIYVLTIKDAEEVTNWLKRKGHKVEAYTGQCGPERSDLENALLHNKVKALIATTALGMGYDKPDLAFVIHYQVPGSVVAYYQQVGRAGRNLEAARGILLGGNEDAAVINSFIDAAFPTRQQVEMILDALSQAPAGMTLNQMLSETNISHGRLKNALEIMKLDTPQPVHDDGKRWRITGREPSEDFWERTDRLTMLRQYEMFQMQEFIDLKFGEHMEYLIRALGDTPEQIAQPSLPPLSSEIDHALLEEANSFLEQQTIPLEPRKRWPYGGLPDYGLNHFIHERHLCETGRALSYPGQGRLGQIFRKCFKMRTYLDKLVDASHDLMDRWKPEPFPEWVTCVPSSICPCPVESFAFRLAKQLDLPFFPVIQRDEVRQQQCCMKNSVHQARNLDGAFYLVDRPLPGPVLLIDDYMMSGWTITICAWLLRENGAGLVWPLVLAKVHL